MKTLTEIQDLLASTLVTQEDKRKQRPEAAGVVEPDLKTQAPPPQE